MDFPNFKNETKHLASGYDYIVGVDEVGVSPLADPVVAAACILDPESIGKYRSKNKWYHRVRDSKTTTEAERETLRKLILDNAHAHGVGKVWPKDIDKLNIHHATLYAMKLAVLDMLKNLEIRNKSGQAKILIFTDGRFKIPGLIIENIIIDQESVIAGDRKILSISAASIIAKVHRDTIMKKLDIKFPVYGFAKHKGYPTRAHELAIRKHGACVFHRKTFLKKFR